MDQFKIITSFITCFKKNISNNNVIIKDAIDTVVGEILTLASYSNIIQDREANISLYNVCGIAKHIIDIRRLILLYDVLFIDLYDLFNKLPTRIGLLKIEKKKTCEDAQLLEKLKIIFGFIKKLDFYLNNSNIEKKEIDNATHTIDFIENTLNKVAFELTNMDYTSTEKVKRSLQLCTFNFEHCKELSLELVSFTEKVFHQLDLDDCD